MTLENGFALRLKELLEHKKLTLQAVATALEVSRPAVHKWTRGGKIDYTKLRKLAVILDVNWIWLRYGEQAQGELESSRAVELPMTDVRRRYTAQIMESEARMKLAQEGAGIVTWEWNLVSDEVSYSANVEEVYGWHINSNASFWKHVHADDIPMMEKVYLESMQTGAAHEFDFRIFLPNGSLRWITSRATPVREIDGRIVKIVGISMNSSARKAVEQALRREQARLRAVLDLAGEGMALFDEQLQCIAVNPALAGMLGFADEELMGERLLTLFPNQGARIREMACGEAPLTQRSSLRKREGERLAVLVRASLDWRESSDTPGIVMTIRPE